MTIFIDGFLFGLGISLALLCGLPFLFLMAFVMHEIEKRWMR